MSLAYIPILKYTPPALRHVGRLLYVSLFLRSYHHLYFQHVIFIPVLLQNIKIMLYPHHRESLLILRDVACKNRTVHQRDGYVLPLIVHMAVGNVVSIFLGADLKADAVCAFHRVPPRQDSGESEFPQYQARELLLNLSVLI